MVEVMGSGGGRGFIYYIINTLLLQLSGAKSPP